MISHKLLPTSRFLGQLLQRLFQSILPSWSIIKVFANQTPRFLQVLFLCLWQRAMFTTIARLMERDSPCVDHFCWCVEGSRTGEVLTMITIRVQENRDNKFASILDVNQRYKGMLVPRLRKYICPISSLHPISTKFYFSSLSSLTD